ncbi:MAG: hypothetical protein ACOH2M_15425 [Cypionkella sp.]
MEKIIGTQDAQAPEGDGTTIYEVQEYADAAAPITPDLQPSGIKRFELADGRVLKLVGLGEYKVDGTDEMFLGRGEEQAEGPERRDQA